MPAGTGVLIITLVAYALLAAFSITLAGIERDPVAPLALIVLGQSA